MRYPQFTGSLISHSIRAITLDTFQGMMLTQFTQTYTQAVTDTTKKPAYGAEVDSLSQKSAGLSHYTKKIQGGKSVAENHLKQKTSAVQHQEGLQRLYFWLTRSKTT